MRLAPLAACLLALVDAPGPAVSRPRPGLPPVPGKSTPGDPLPSRFLASIGGFGGSSYSVRLHGGVLTYRAREFDPKSQQFVETSRAVTPPPEQWRRFWAAMDEVGLWGWRPAYINQGVFDGTTWGVDVASAGRSIRSRGGNLYPGSDPAAYPDTGPLFAKFLAAVESLVGGRTYR